MGQDIQQTLRRIKNESEHFHFMEVFEVSKQPLWVGLALSGWWPTFSDGEFCLDVVARPWVWAGLPKNVCHHQ